MTWLMPSAVDDHGNSGCELCPAAGRRPHLLSGEPRFSGQLDDRVVASGVVDPANAAWMAAAPAAPVRRQNRADRGDLWQRQDLVSAASGDGPVRRSGTRR